MKKHILLYLTMIILAGCSSTPKDLYILSTAKEPAVKFTPIHEDIGVEDVTIPKHLTRRGISVAKSSSEISILTGAIWAEDLDIGLTNRLIAFLQKKFQQPTVYHYPWGISKPGGLKVKVQITRFIAQDNNIYLEANWEASRLDSGKRVTKLFSTVVPVSLFTAAAIVNAMDDAFGKLETQIAEGIQKL